jgi:hypothetical protein
MEGAVIDEGRERTTTCHWDIIFRSGRDNALAEIEVINLSLPRI